MGFPCGSVGKESACNAGGLGLIPGLGSTPGAGKGYPLQYSGLENSIDCIVDGVTKSGQDWVTFTFTFCKKYYLGITNFLEEISSLSHSIVFLLFLCIDHLGRLFYFSLLFFGTLHSDGYVFPFLLCLSLLFFLSYLLRPPRTTTLLFCISFSWGWSWSPPPIQYYKTLSIVPQALYQI